jgi:sugar/nucleoside kinase (ribokinase family)
MADVVCLGILVADVFASPLDSMPREGDLSLIDRYITSVGGCAANTAVDLIRLGRSSCVLGKIGDDLFGDYVLKDLKSKGIDTAFLSVSKTRRTSLTFILNVQGQDRRYIHCSGANADFSLKDVPLAALDGARALYVGGFLALPVFRSEQLLQLLREARQRGLATVLDVVIPAGSSASLDDVRPILPYADVFLPNTDEARVLTGRSDAVEQAAMLAQVSSACTIVITLGRAGAVVRRANETWRVGAFTVDSVDESGGGDAFDAGFLVGMLEGWSIEETVAFASAVGASCTRAMGCHEGVFTFEEAKTYVERNHLEITRLA